MYNGKRTTTSRSTSINNSRKGKSSKQDKTYEGYYYDDYYEETADNDRGQQNSHQSGKVGYGFKAQEVETRNINNNNEEDSGFYYEDEDSGAGSNTAFGCGEFEDPFTGEIRNGTQWRCLVTKLKILGSKGYLYNITLVEPELQRSCRTILFK